MPSFPECQAAAQFSAARDFRSRSLAFGKFVVFAALFFAFLQVLSIAMRPVRLSGIGWQALAGNLSVAVAALSATAVLSLFDARGFGAFGLGGSDKARNFLYGLGLGMVLLTALLALLRLVSGFRFGAVATHGIAAVQFGALYAALFLAVALAEECLWRGYALVKLSQGISFWPAAMLLSLIFGADHWKHAGENTAGIVFACLFGVVLAWSFRRTGSLWLALGVHAGWNYCQSFVFGVPDSGVVLPGALLRAHLSGPAWLTGGSAGPEGSVLMVLVLPTLALAILFIPVAADRDRASPARAAGPTA